MKKYISLSILVGFYLAGTVVLSSGVGNYEDVEGTDTVGREVYSLPEAILSFGDSGGEIVLVEKASQRLHVFGGSYEKVGTFQVTTGANPGDKMRSGDKKTPEGVYFFTDLMEEKELFPEYGVMALVTDYPNPIDMAKQKNGSGIWLHATNQPERPLTPRDTRGCVVAVNEDILSVAKHIDLEMTPFVIVDELKYVPSEQLSAERIKVYDFLREWEDSWESKDIESYISYYSETFNSKGMSREEWKKYKKRLNRKYNLISVALQDLKVVKSSGYLVATFIQNYQGDNFKDSGVKRLYIVEESGALKIVGEEWRNMPTKNPKVVADDYLQRIAMRQKDLSAPPQLSEPVNFKSVEKAL